MKSTTIKSVLLAMGLLGIIFTSQAQKNYELSSKQNYSVLGTSTLHDWEMESKEATGSAKITLTDSKITTINALTINILSESIKSGKGGMDKIAYKTLNTKKFKTIKYVLKSAEKVNETTWNLLGTYTIAGVSKDLKTQVKTTVNNGVINLQGSNKITFDEFGMESPTALLGTIKTGKELTIKFNINFN